MLCPYWHQQSSNVTGPGWRTRPLALPPCWWDQSTETRSTQSTGRRSRLWFGERRARPLLFILSHVNIFQTLTLDLAHLPLLHLLCPPLPLYFTTHLSPSQTTRYIGAGGGNYSVSLLWLPATAERTAVHLLQEQPALLHRHGTCTRWHSLNVVTKNKIVCFTFVFSSFCLCSLFIFSGSPYAERRLVRVFSLWISCSLLTAHSVSGALAAKHQL